MATMINCAIDWSFDLLLEDLSQTSALPMARGVVRHYDNLGKEFCTWLHTFTKSVVSEYEAMGYKPWEVTDAWEYEVNNSFFSDYYKDCYNQRPHFPLMYLAKALGLYTPCWYTNSDLKEHANLARMYREQLEAMA